MSRDNELDQLFFSFNEQRLAVGLPTVRIEQFRAIYYGGLLDTSSMPFKIIPGKPSNPMVAAALEAVRDQPKHRGIWDFEGFNRPDEEETYKFRDFAEAQAIINRFREGNRALKENVIKLKKENDYFRQRNEEQLKELEKLRAIVEAIEGLTTNTARRPIQRGINDV